MSRTAFCLPAFLLATLLATDLSAQDLVLTNARIIDPAARTVSNGALWIRDGRIAGRGERVPADARGERIDLAGKFVIPAFTDMHVHSFGNMAPGQIMEGTGPQNTAERVLRAGVTAFLDLFSAEDFILPLRDRQRKGEIGGAEILAAGPCFTATRGHCSEYGVPTRLINTPEEARQQLAQLLPKRPDVIKVVYDHFNYGPNSLPSIDSATLNALLSGAREASVKTIVHVGTWEDVRHAVLAGASAVTHVARGVVPADVVTLMKERGTYHIPTLVVHTDLAELLDKPALLEEPLPKATVSDTLRAAYRRAGSVADPRTTNWIASQRAGKAGVLETVRRLHAGGVPMLTGTDAGNLGTVHGYSVHRELIRLREAGLSSWDALAAATTNAGKFLNRKFGVQPGDEANLIVLTTSPLDDIANTQTIEKVIQRGRVVHGK